MAHEYKEYFEELCKDIEKLAKLAPTPERVRMMHDYLYVKKHLMKHDDMHSTEMTGNSKSSYFGG